jgi:hypothetical protein
MKRIRTGFERELVTSVNEPREEQDEGVDDRSVDGEL